MSSGAVTDLKVALDIESAKFRNELEKVTKSIDGVAGKLNRLSDKVGDGAASVFKGILSWNAFSSTLGRAGHFLSEGIKGFAEEEQASLRLSSALSTLGYNASALLPPLEAQQRMFEALTPAQGETVAQMQQLMLQYGVAPKSIERTTQAILDYSAATGQDALSSTTALLHAVNEGKDGVKSLGLQYVSTGDAAKDLDTAVDQLTDKFGGSAKSAASGLAGSLDQLAKAQENLGKSFGGFFATLESKLHLLRTLSNGLNQIRKEMGGASPEEEQHDRQVRIEELVKERMEWQEKLGNKILALKAQAEIAKINAEIRRLQGESAGYLKGTPGAVHTDSPLGGNTAITTEVSKTAKEANKPKPEKKSIDVSKAADGGIGAQFRPFESLAGAHFAELQEMGKRLAEAMRTPLEVFKDEVKKLDQLWDAGTISAETYNRALKDATEKYRDATDAVSTLADTSLADLGREGLGHMGKIGEVVSAASGPLATAAAGVAKSAGAGAAAGPLGALIGVLAAILTESEAFMQLVSLAAEVVKVLANALGPIIDPINRVVAALIPVGEALGEMLAPLGMLVDAVLRPMVPAYLVMANLFGALEPLLQMLVGLLVPIVYIMEVPMHAALYAFFHAVKYLGLGILEVAGFIAPVMNGLFEALRAAFSSLANVQIAGIKPFGFLNDWAKTLEGAIVSTDEINAKKAELAALDWDAAQAKADEVAATKKVTEAANEAAASLFNLPAGYKIEAARYAAAAAMGGMKIPAFADGGVVSRAQLALVGEGGEPEVIAPESMLRKVMREEGGRGKSINVQIVSNDAEQIWRKIKRLAERDRYNLTGDLT